MCRKFLLSLFCVMSSGLALPAYAQTTEGVRVEVNKGSMIKLSKRASSVIVADPLIADVQIVSPKLIYVNGKKVGETSIYAVDAQDNTILNSTIEVTHNLSKLKRMVREVAPGAEVNFRSMDSGLVIEGAGGSLEQSEQIRSIAAAFIGAQEKVVNMMTANGSDQVTLQVKVVEMARNDLKRLGINLAAAISPGSTALQIFQGANIVGTPGTALGRTDATTSNLGFSYAGGSTSISSMIDALETQGLVSILAEPTLTTTSGKTANFLAGGEFPIPVPQASGSGGTTVTLEYRPFGVKLDFTPIVQSKDRITMTVAPEVSTLDFNNPLAINGFRSPIINTRRAQSTVELGSGQTFALAGLLRNDMANTVDKFPGLGDLPVLGALFRSHNFQTAQTELVILVTPYIVRPVSDPEALQTSSDGFVPPDDRSRILDGDFYEQEPIEPELAADAKPPTLHGPSGLME